LKPREAAIFAAVTDAYCAPAGALPPVRETDALAFMDHLFALSAPLNRIGFRVILRLLDLAPLARGYGAVFARLGTEDRARFIQGIDKSRWFLMRTTGRLLKTVAVMAYYGDARVLKGLGYDSEANVARGHAHAESEPAKEQGAESAKESATEPAKESAKAAPAGTTAPLEGSNGARPTGDAAYADRSGAVVPGEARVRSGHRQRRNLTVAADACVIGTGAGGAVVAKELAEAGLSVAMLEEGAMQTPSAYNARPRDMSVLLYRDVGEIATVGVPPIVLPLGRSVGGSSHINSATCFRTPSAVLEMWRERFGLEELAPEEIDPYFRRVERELNVVRTPAAIAGRNADVVKRGADRLGYSGGYVYRNVRGCVGSGVCNFGCPSAAKQHVGVTYVPKAWAAGATTYTEARARRIVLDGRRVRGVEATLASGRRLHVRCEIAIVAAGAIHTPLFLRRQRLEDPSGQVGLNLSLHPAAGVRALFEERIEMWRGVPQSYYVDEFANERIMLEGAAGTPDTIATSLPYSGERHRELMERCANLSQFGLMVSDTSRGRVWEIGRRLFVNYDLNDVDTLAFKRGIEILSEIYRAAGATRIYPPIAGLPEIGPGEIERLRRYELSAAELALIAFHPLGTCRMGADPESAPVDPSGRLRGYEGLYLADGSIVPSSLGVNPQITIMALATRIAFMLAGQRPPVEEPAPERMAEPRVSAAHL
jgi:choline dehydrogenase-like flavoprotein